MEMFRYCPRCATPLEDFPEGVRVRRRCPACDLTHYHNPVPAAGGIVCRDRAICLVRRAVEPRKGLWCLPAGFMEYEESAQQCAAREVAEETGLDVETQDLLGVYSGFDDPRQHAVLVVFWMREIACRPAVAGDDAEAVAFFRPEEIPADLAFRAHREALRDALAHPRHAHTFAVDR
jgi:ADP-ribose pyrophosphatase YjhB (NUDIX family)